MLVAVIPVKDWVSVYHDIASVKDKAEAYELRLDYLARLDWEALRALRKSVTLPVILTLRSSHQADLEALCSLSPDYVDVEYDTPTILCQQLKAKYPTVKLIRSYHNFEETPDLSAIFKQMQDPSIDIYKIATFANNTQDALRMLRFVQSLSQAHPIIGLCMGEAGQCTRILGKIVGSVMTYAACNAASVTAPGQLTVAEHLTHYHYTALNKETAIFALLGFPVDKSPGHILHNQAMVLLGVNAVYVKLFVPDGLAEVLNLCRQLPFKGFSVTKPLKEAIVPLLEEVSDTAQAIGAVNTVFQGSGLNTDGPAVMQILAKRCVVSEQTIVILGAGGAARAIAYHAHVAGARVIIVNRTHSRAQALAKEFGCEVATVEELSKIAYTVLINTTPDVNASSNGETIHFDINHGTSSGNEMFVEQALMQIDKWFQPSASKREAVQRCMLAWVRGI